MNQTANPELYRKLSEPFGSKEEADTEIAAFFEAVSQLRQKHLMPDVIVMAQANVIHEGDETIMQATAGFGDPLRMVTMLAQALGREQAENDAYLGKLLKAARRGVA